MKLRAPSPALVISFIALLVALSATAYAATRITRSSQIKNGIVTSADLKNSTITSADIKNKTVRNADLSDTTLRRIDRGGSPGNTVALEGIRKVGPVGQPANQLRQVATMTIPAGAYVITAKTTLSGVVDRPVGLEEGVAAATGTCRLDSAGDVDQADTTIVVDSRPTPGSMYMQAVRTLGGAGAITLTCASSVPWNTTNTSIIAQRVGATQKGDIGG